VTAKGSTGLRARLSGRVGDLVLDADFSAPAQGVTALIGPSGSGKTTLLRCIAGLTRLAGEVAFNGEAWQAKGTFRPPHLRPIGYVFQEASLFSHLSVRGNLEFALKRARAARSLSIGDVAELMGLGPLLARSTARLSGGERQRVAIGRALLSQPQLLLMDEPVSSLDGEAKAEVLSHLERLHRSLSIPVLYVSHDPGEIVRLADRVLMMSHGRVQSPTPGDGAPLSDEDARRHLAGLSGDRLTELALAALKAGLGGR
jgi:molybdate transport system ATP-binding protein